MLSLRARLAWIQALVMVALAGCSGETDSLPPELYGRWITPHARYAGRYFEVTSTGELVFGQGEGATHGGVVESITNTPLKTGGESCEITYADAQGTEFRVTLVLSADRASFVFESSNKIRWKRVEETS